MPKRGVGYCKSMPGAVKAYQRLLNRGKWEPQRRKPRNEKERARRPEPPPLKKPQPTDPVFPGDHSGLFNKILEQENLKLDREGKPRTAYPPARGGGMPQRIIINSRPASAFLTTGAG